MTDRIVEERRGAIKPFEVHDLSEKQGNGSASILPFFLLFQKREKEKKKETDAGREVISRGAGAVLFTGNDSFV